MQVLDGVVMGRIEQAATTTSHGQRMAIAIENTLEIISRIIYCEVGIHDGVHALRAAVFQCRPELFPVAVVFEEVAELLGGIAVVDYHVTSFVLSCPCLTEFGVGFDTGGHEEAVFDDCKAPFVNPSDETTVSYALFTLKAAIESTVGDGNIGIGYASN